MSKKRTSKVSASPRRPRTRDREKVAKEWTLHIDAANQYKPKDDQRNLALFRFISSCTELLVGGVKTEEASIFTR